MTKIYNLRLTNTRAQSVITRDLHGNGDNGNTAVTAVMEATAAVIPR